MQFLCQEQAYMTKSSYKYLTVKSNNIYSHSDLPEDFFEVTEKDVRKMMQDLQKNV
jgi:hypothetical protein